MREIKIASPSEWSMDIARMALTCGAKAVSISEVRTPLTSKSKHQIKIKTSSPVARRFLEGLYQTSLYSSSAELNISSHNIRGLDTREGIYEATRPFCVPLMEVYEDLWQNSHITPSFLIRVISSAMLLTYAMLTDQVILMIGAMLFTVFSPPLMAVGLGLPMKERALILQGVKAFVWANLLSIVAAMGVAVFVHRSLASPAFGSWTGNLFISFSAGLAGAIADADDAGRRQLIAIAAAFPYSRFPIWIGISLVQGFPPLPETLERLGIFTTNILAMIISAAIVYRCIGAHSRTFFKSCTK